MDKKDTFTHIKEVIIADCKKFEIPIPKEIREATIDEKANITDPPSLMVIKPNPEEPAAEQARHLLGHWLMDYEAVKEQTFSSDDSADIIARILHSANNGVEKEIYLTDDELNTRIQKAEGLLNRIYGFMQQEQFSVHLLGGLQKIAKEINEWRASLSSLKKTRQSTKK